MTILQRLKKVKRGAEAALTLKESRCQHYMCSEIPLVCTTLAVTQLL